MSTADDKKARARKWVNGYTVAGTAVVIAAIIPGTTPRLWPRWRHTCVTQSAKFIRVKITR